MARKISEAAIQKHDQTERRKIYRALGLDKNGHFKKTAAQKRLEKLLKWFDFSKIHE